MDHAYLELARVRRGGQRGLLATVVKGVGPTYRKPGASAVMVEDGTILGAISGGCLESDVLAAAEDVLAGGPARLLEYDTAGEDDLIWGTGSGCGGRVQVLVAAVPDEVLAFVAGHLAAGRAAAVATIISAGPDLGRRLAVQGTQSAATLGRPERDQACAEPARKVLAGGLSPLWLPLDGVEAMVQAVQPPPTFLLLGAGDDARPVARLARASGFRVLVVDHRPAWATPERFPWADQVVACDADEIPDRVDIRPGTYAVLMTHHFFKDLAHLKMLLARPVAYVGLLGARERSRRLAEMIRDEAPELYAAAKSKLWAPVGLDIGADGPEEIALAILAEAVAVRSGRPGVPLMRSRGPVAT